MSIASQQVIGTRGNTGDIRTGGVVLQSDQFSQLAVSSTPLSGASGSAPAVRMQASGQSGYVGVYYWNNGSPELMLFLRNAGTGPSWALQQRSRCRPGLS